jgi:hypothetical protein
MKEVRIDIVTLARNTMIKKSREELLIIFNILKRLLKNSTRFFICQLIAIFCQLGDD